ncbi:pseudouridine synthase-like protein [Yersinia phage YerA41]|uniref:Pseudouridine synthase-like protein n=1 Tax=Yersinia phage vB_Yru_GN1 TaxID=3074381 RepID=A0AA86IYC4_9CAUD|nr:pseudouridine synthase-like protein [Yersinia phage YerA41]BES79859.1 pseudouridine synthase-like protein [Yersinia phage vB_Yru_GN1]
MSQLIKMKYYVKASSTYSDGWGGTDTDYYDGIVILDKPINSTDELKNEIRNQLKINRQSFTIVTMVQIP